MNFTQVLSFHFYQLKKDIAILLTIIGGVILYSFLYPLPYLNQNVSELKIAIVDYDRTDLSRKFKFMLDSSPDVEVYRVLSSINEAKEEIVSGDIAGFVVIPKDMKKMLYLQEQPIFSIAADNSYFLKFGSLVEASMKTILTASANIKVIRLMKNGELPSAWAPFTFEMINMYNVNGSYLLYVIPAVFVLILQQTLLIGMGIYGGRLNELRDANDARIKLVDEAGVIKNISAQFLLFGSIYFIHTLYYFGFAFAYYDIVRLADVVDILVLSSIFLFATLLLGYMIGLLFKTREVATPLVLLSSLPLVFSAGFIWPLEELPKFMVYISSMFPSTPAIEAFVRLNQMGADFSEIFDQVYLLLIQICIYFVIILFILYLKKSAKRGF